MQKVITAGKSLVEERLHLLKIADKWGWSAVNEFTTTDMAMSEVEEKKLKKIAKAQESKFEKQKDRKGGKKTPYFHSAKGYTGSGDNIRYCSEKARAFPFIKTSSGDLEMVEQKTEERMSGWQDGSAGHSNRA